MLLIPILSSALLAQVSGHIPGQPYERFTTKDSLDREITYYLSEEKVDTKLPLVLYIQGSGNSSHFAEVEGKIRPQNGHAPIRDVFAGKARVLLVEKPGVRYLDAGNSNLEDEARPEFHEEHTLERWTIALQASLEASVKTPNVDSSRILVIGHSEGGLPACRLARIDKRVTHVASLAGGGLSQLVDLVSLARRGEFFTRVSEDPEERVKYVLDRWKSILADPQATDKFFFGHCYRRWHSFLSSSPLEELQQTSARIFIGQGVLDTATELSSVDALYAQLIAKGKDVTYMRVAGANHSFSLKDQPNHDGWVEIMEEIHSWFLDKK